MADLDVQLEWGHIVASVMKAHMTLSYETGVAVGREDEAASNRLFAEAEHLLCLYTVIDRDHLEADTDAIAELKQWLTEREYLL